MHGRAFRSFMLQWHRVQITPAAAAMDINRQARVSPPDAPTYFETGQFHPARPKGNGNFIHTPQNGSRRNLT